MNVKFLDLKAQYPLILNDIKAGFEDVFDTTGFVSGKYVKDFEEKFAQYIGVKHCVAVNNGTVALVLALMALGVKAGDEVLVPVNTFIATAEAVSMVGAKPVFVDIDEKTFNIDLTKVEEKITSRTRAIMPVHLYGQTVDMDALMQFAAENGLIVIEDACQAHGALWKGRRVGSFGGAAGFSFYPGKNLGAFGDAGAVVTDSDEVADFMRLFREHGSKKKYHHEIVGLNFRLNEFQGVVLGKKLPYLDGNNELRNKNAGYYLDRLTKIKGVVVPVQGESGSHVWHLFVVRVEDRQALMDFLLERGITSLVHYPTPLHLTEAYKSLGYVHGDFPVAERVQSQILSLPMYPELKKEEIDYVCDSIEEFFR